MVLSLLKVSAINSTMRLFFLLLGGEYSAHTMIIDFGDKSDLGLRVANVTSRFDGISRALGMCQDFASRNLVYMLMPL